MDLTNLYSSCINGDLKKLKRTCETLKVNNNNGDFLKKPDHHGFFPLDLTVIHEHFECCQYLFDTFNINWF